MQRIGRPIKQRAIMETTAPVANSQSNSRVENPANIQITNIVGSTVQPSVGIDPLASTLDTGAPEYLGADTKPGGMKSRGVELDDIIATPIEEGDNVEVLDPNPKLHRFRAQRLDNVEYIADVQFLEHVIHTLITNHNITVKPADIEAMLSYFGECAVNTRIEHCMTRDVDAEPTCCGTTQKQREQAIEVIKSVILNGLNIAKSIPSMQQFMGRLGIGF
jgi:hypothetical protein